MKSFRRFFLSELSDKTKQLYVDASERSSAPHKNQFLQRAKTGRRKQRVRVIKGELEGKNELRRHGGGAYSPYGPDEFTLHEISCDTALRAGGMRSRQRYTPRPDLNPKDAKAVREYHRNRATRNFKHYRDKMVNSKGPSGN